MVAVCVSQAVGYVEACANFISHILDFECLQNSSVEVHVTVWEGIDFWNPTSV